MPAQQYITHIAITFDGTTPDSSKHCRQDNMAKIHGFNHVQSINIQSEFANINIQWMDWLKPD